MADYDISNLPLVDLMIMAEAKLERRLALCLALQPKDVIEKTTNFHPEADPLVIRYWNSVIERRGEIMRSTHEKARDISLQMLLENRSISFWQWWNALADENSILTIDKTLADIRGLRIARKAAVYIQENRIIENSLSGGGNG